MTDERIKEEFEKWAKECPTNEELVFAFEYAESQNEDISQAFYAGVRITEHIAQVETLESLLNDSRMCSENYIDIIQEAILILKCH